ncbi:MAG TPA: hypothetical protein VFX84_03140 [Candidatus Saccharimonadales bacterium]|nr:hypothetical protein [Candidatus Saccharimonadales bacterium]
MSELRSYKRVRSVGGVQRDLYGRAAELAGELEAMRPEERAGNHTFDIPGTDLEIRHKSRQGQMPGALHGSSGGRGVPTTIISARNGNTKTNLLAVAEVPGLPASRPASTVNGYKGSELGGHYWLSREESGLVRVHLGSPTTTVATEEEPLLGQSAMDKSDRLGHLDAADSERLYLAVQGILANMTAVETLAAGGPAGDVLEERAAGLGAD